MCLSCSAHKKSLKIQIFSLVQKVDLILLHSVISRQEESGIQKSMQQSRAQAVFFIYINFFKVSYISHHLLDSFVTYSRPINYITPIFYKQLEPNRVAYVFCHFRLSSCLIYNGVSYFGGCLVLFDQIRLGNCLIFFRSRVQVLISSC